MNRRVIWLNEWTYQCRILWVIVSVLAWILFVKLHSRNEWLMRALHVLLFAPWTFLLLASFKTMGRMKAWKQYALLLAVAAVCELIQFWTPNHDPEWKGLFASLIGIVIGRELFKLANRVRS